MEKIHYTAKRKPDVVTWLAVFLFVLIVGLELMLVLWLPIHLRAKGKWDLQSSLQEMIELEDNLRANFSDIAKDRGGFAAGEIGIAAGCLDETARYLKKYGEKLNRQQVSDIHGDLKKISLIYSRLRTKQYYSKFLKIDPSKFLKEIGKDCDLEIKPAENTGNTAQQPAQNEKGNAKK